MRPKVAEPHEFDIYQTDAGYVAVTNDVRRKILAAVAKKERGLPELVKITGKAKPTLSNLHVRELLEQNLLEELPHPTDARKKIYRLRGTRIGSSNVPLDQLRGAVKHYVSLSPLAHALPLKAVFEVLASGGPRAKDAIHKQGATLGTLSSQLLAAPDLRELLPRVAAHWEREGLTRTVRIDLEDLALDVDVDPKHEGAPDTLETLAAALAGFLEGVARRQDPTATVAGRVTGPRRVRVTLAR